MASRSPTNTLSKKISGQAQVTPRSGGPSINSRAADTTQPGRSGAASITSKIIPQQKQPAAASSAMLPPVSPRGGASQSEIQESVKAPLTEEDLKKVALIEKLLALTNEELRVLKKMTVQEFENIIKIPEEDKKFKKVKPLRTERMTEYSRFMYKIRTTEDELKALKEAVKTKEDEKEKLKSNENEYRKGLLKIKKMLENKLGIPHRKYINRENVNSENIDVSKLINYISVLVPFLNSRNDINLLKNYILQFKSQYNNYLRELKNNISDIKKINIMKKNYFLNHF